MKSSISREEFIRNRENTVPTTLAWGELRWLSNAAIMPGAEQTLGICTILPGQSNPLHTHPNCEELLYVISGECRHRVGEESFSLTAGDVIRIPRDVAHCATCTSDVPLIAVISFSSSARKTIALEINDELA